MQVYDEDEKLWGKKKRKKEKKWLIIIIKERIKI